MEIRERLLRNEIRHLGEDLRAVSKELITLQDFVRLEFGLKYVRFCDTQSRNTGDENEDYHGQERLSHMSTLRQPERRGNPFGGDGSVNVRVTRSSASSASAVNLENFAEQIEPLSTTYQDENTAELLEFNSQIVFAKTEPLSPGYRHYTDEGTEEMLEVQCQRFEYSDPDPSNQLVFNESNEGEPGEDEDFDSYIPGSDGEVEDSSGSSRISHEATSSKRKENQNSVSSGDDETYNLSSGSGVLPRKRGNNREWLKVQSFENAKCAEDFVASEKNWSRSSRQKSLEGSKVYFRCKLVPSNKHQQCPASLQLLYHSDSQKVTMFRTSGDHEYHEEGTHGLAAEVKAVILQLFEDGVTKPKAILSSLRSRNIKEPPISKLINCLKLIRKQKYGASSRKKNFPLGPNWNRGMTSKAKSSLPL